MNSMKAHDSMANTDSISCNESSSRFSVTFSNRDSEDEGFQRNGPRNERFIRKPQIQIFRKEPSELRASKSMTRTMTMTEDPSLSKEEEQTVQYRQYTLYKPMRNVTVRRVSMLPFRSRTPRTRPRNRPPLHVFNHYDKSHVVAMELDEEGDDEGMDPFEEGIEEEMDENDDDDAVTSTLSPCSSVGSTLL